MLSVSAFFKKALEISVSEAFFQQTRNTFVLKRHNPFPLHKKGGKPTKMRGRHFVYDFVKDTNVLKQPDLQIILKEYVEGVGNVGDILTMRPNHAYQKFLLPGLAIYASPDNKEKYKTDENKPMIKDKFSSPHVERTMNVLSGKVLQITMNKLTPWTLEPWHIKTSFRKLGFVVPEHAIIMPPGVISGPDLTLQDKEFYITVVINKTEKVNVRCRIHHYATGLERLPWVEHHWKKPKEPLFPEQAEVLEKIPLA